MTMDVSVRLSYVSVSLPWFFLFFSLSDEGSSVRLLWVLFFYLMRDQVFGYPAFCLVRGVSIVSVRLSRLLMIVFGHPGFFFLSDEGPSVRLPWAWFCLVKDVSVTVTCYC